jgi:hypothetical protein
VLAEANHHLVVVGTNLAIIGAVLTVISIAEVWLYGRTAPRSRTGVWTGYRRGWLVMRVISPVAGLIGVVVIVFNR